MSTGKVTLSTQKSCPTESKSQSIVEFDQIIIHLNVGGYYYCTLLSTLLKHASSWLARMFNCLSSPLNNSLNNHTSSPSSSSTIVNKKEILPKDSEGRYFIDRDGYLFKFILEFLRNDRIFLPKDFDEVLRLKNEMEFYRLTFKDMNFDSGKSMLYRYDLQNSRASLSSLELIPEWLDKSRTITVGYQGTFGFGRDGLVDVKFRKLSRLLVAGHAGLCRWTFEDTLNDNRDPERCSEDRYSSRFFLKHNNLEQAFECLYEKGFNLVGSCGSGTHSGSVEVKPSHHIEESRWQHYNEFVFARKLII